MEAREQRDYGGATEHGGLGNHKKIHTPDIDFVV
jgi:hypothetical protein